jgi:hypothetical protein
VDLLNDPAARAYFVAGLLRPDDPAGFTWCFEDLAAPYFDVTEQGRRLREPLPVSVKANALCNDTSDKTPSGLWPSDHMGVWVRFTF